ncbi:hypothetical protein CH063_03561 [Colletotrichum higginsianum]|uniref:Uncharacterized protein n=1 Tax=Colletotrichum higginsianum (strain IMI 349063) TaxID=759273 RepID=H1VYH0_COLHI|nr:hypothetical protein CH063_03561 [Colletotrichum higginsianum]
MGQNFQAGGSVQTKWVYHLSDEALSEKNEIYQVEEEKEMRGEKGHPRQEMDSFTLCQHYPSCPPLDAKSRVGINQDKGVTYCLKAATEVVKSNTGRQSIIIIPCYRPQSFVSVCSS